MQKPSAVAIGFTRAAREGEGLDGLLVQVRLLLRESRVQHLHKELGYTINGVLDVK